jgi:hypothetical protein
MTALSLLPSSPVIAAEPLRVLASGRDTTTRWTAYKVVSTGASYTMDFAYEIEKDPLQVGGLFYDEQNKFMGGFTWTAYTYQNRVRYEVTTSPTGPLVGDHHVETFGYRATFAVGGTLPGTPGEPTVRKIIIWSSGSLAKGVDWTFKAAPGAALVTNPQTATPVTTTGTRAFVHLSRDFDAAAQVDAQGTAPRVPDVVPNGIGPGARATALGVLRHKAEQTLVGGFQVLGGTMSANVNPVMRVTAPNGFRQDCLTLCQWFDFQAPTALTPGTYTFELTGVGAGPGPFSDVLLWGLDATLPI